MKTSYHERDYTCGQAILTLRNKIGLTQERLGSLLGISTRAVAGWEGGSNYPKVKHLKALIELAVQQQAFPKEATAEEIRRFWKVAHQKMLIDEDWLSSLLSQQNGQPSDVEPEAVEPTRSSTPSPLPNAGVEPDWGPGRMADPLDWAVGAAVSPDSPRCGSESPYPPQETSITPDLTQAEMSAHHRDRANLWHEEQYLYEPQYINEEQYHHNQPSNLKSLDILKKLEWQKWLLLSLIALVILTVIGSAGALFVQARDLATTQAHIAASQTAIAQAAYPGYLPGKGTLAFFDPLSQERGSRWSSSSLSSDGGACQFTGGAYHISQQKMIGAFASCWTNAWFSNFALEVQVTITQGDCGGIVFRYNHNGDYYYFLFCQNDAYWLSKYINGLHDQFLYADSSSALHTGLGQQNTIALVASGQTMTIYANEQPIAQSQDDSYTLGNIALVADPIYRHVTDVAYRNARMWLL